MSSTSRRSLLFLVVSTAVVATLASCASDESGSDEPVAADTVADSLAVVVIGDSIPNNAPGDCPGCTGFADAYATALEESVGATVTLDNESRHDGAQTHDIEEQLASSDLDDTLEPAGVVLVSIGFNDQPPYSQSGQPCNAVVNSDEEAIQAVAATTEECVDEVTDTVQREASSVLSQVRDKAPDATIAALVPYDSWRGWSALTDRPEKEVAKITTIVTYALDQWRTALCEEVEAVEGTCVDVYRQFNGLDGARAAGDLLAEDHTHPSQLGNDAILALLLEADLVS
jgi:hypothetical protein